MAADAIIESEQADNSNFSQNSGSIKKEKLLNLEFLKFVLAIIIILYHSWHYGAIPTMFPHLEIVKKLTLAYSGNLAVDAFFIISGFLLLYTFNNSISVLDFIKKKIIRLWPMVAVFAGTDVIIQYFINHTPHYMPYDQILRILMIENIGLNIYFSKVTWYVSVLLWISTLFFYLIKNFSKKIVDLIVPLLVVFCYAFLIHAYKGNVCSIIDSKYYIFNAGVMRGIAGMGTGYLIFNFYNSMKPYIPSVRKWLGYTIAECCLLFFVLNYLAFHKLEYHSNFVILVGIVILLILFILKRGGVSKLLNNKFSAVLGRYSYSIYIIHMFVLTVFRTYLYKPYPKFVETHTILCIILPIICAILAGIVLYHLIEVPAGNYLKKKLFP